MNKKYFKYDVFISYSYRDKAWVLNELLPRIEQFGLRPCIDQYHFVAGNPILLNIEEAVENSRRTLIILTQDWLSSEWANFEVLLTQTRDPSARYRSLIPLLLKPCELPKRVMMLTHLDFTTASERNWQALYNALKPPELDPPSAGMKYTNNISGGADSIKDNRSSSEQYIPIEILNNLRKVINIVDDILVYWNISLSPSMEAVTWAFRDVTNAINLLQEAKQFARNASMRSSIIIKIDDSIRNISDARKSIRILSEAFGGNSNLSPNRVTNIYEQFHRKINEIRVYIFSLLSEISI